MPIDLASFTVERFLICSAKRAFVTSVAIPTPDVVGAFCVVQHIIHGVGDLCRCLCHGLDCDLILNKVECLLKVGPCILDEKQLLHLLGHGCQQFEIVLLAFSHRG